MFHKMARFDEDMLLFRGVCRILRFRILFLEVVFHFHHLHRHTGLSTFLLLFFMTQGSPSAYLLWALLAVTVRCQRCQHVLG